MITDEQIKQLAVSCGFKLTNETGDDLKPYVYEFARELIALAQPQWQPIETVPDSTEVFVAIPKYNNASEHGYLLGWAICIDGQWLSMDDEESSIYTPDYWMHLPQKPQAHGIGGE